jgi:hypothetical protein
LGTGVSYSVLPQRLKGFSARSSAASFFTLVATNAQHNLIRKLYAAFNACDIPAILAFALQVRWSRVWESDYATGHE